ncbi:uncharacterized protein KZ484_010563 isoform 2-T3 [Pholidichthys leucotaenia]
MDIAGSTRTEEVASALNDLESANLVGAVCQADFAQLIDDYFGGQDPVSTDNESESDGSDSEEASPLLDSPADERNNVLDGQNGDIDDVIPEGNLHGENVQDDVHGAGSDSDDDDLQGERGVGLCLHDDADAVLERAADLLLDQDEEVEIQKIRGFECKCAAFKKGQCIKKLDTGLIHSLRQNMQKMNDFEKNIVIIAKISSTLNRSERTKGTKQKETKARRLCSGSYSVEGTRICREAFKFIHCISQNRLTDCINWYKVNGLTPKVKKSGGRRKNARLLSHDDIERVVKFILNYCEDHAIILPGRIPGYKDFRIKLLPSSTTKASVFRLYRSAMIDAGHRAVKITSFRRLWNSLLAFIVKAKPVMDLCWLCQKNNYQVYCSANLPEVIKTAKLKKQEEHLRIVNMESEVYREMVAAAKEVVKEDPNLKLGPHAPCSRNCRMHYSFDFAQQVHLPSDPLQPGPVYFLTPRKCALFGICCEGLPQQANYLIDEASCTTKGASAVISYLHHFFENYGVGEEHVDLHCDNCTKQNKNKVVLWYFAWRVIHGLHKSITLNFLITGHTKFSPDWCFGLIKQKFRKTRVCSVGELADVVRLSTVTGVNIPQPTMDRNGKNIVKHYNWHQKLTETGRAVPDIKKYHHFRFCHTRPGVVFCKEYSDSDEVPETLLKDIHNLPTPNLPPVIPPPGLPPARQWYLFEKIRQFCSEETMDVTCPKPAVSKPQTNNQDEDDMDNKPVHAIPAAAPHGCGHGCGRGCGPGHDVPQQNDFNQEEDLDEQQLLNQERNFIVVQVEADCSQIKEEQEDICISQEGEQFGLKQETETFDEDLQKQHVCENEFSPDQQLLFQQKYSGLEQEEPEPPQVKEEPEELCSSQEGEQLIVKLETDALMVTLISEEKEQREAEPNSEQLCCHNPAVTEIQDGEGGQNVDLKSTKEEEPKPKKRRLGTRRHHEGIQALQHPWKKCVDRRGDYVEK